MLSIKNLFFLPPPAIIALFHVPPSESIKYSHKISDVYLVNVAAPSSNDNPRTKDISKSFTSKDDLVDLFFLKFFKALFKIIFFILPDFAILPFSSYFFF